MLLLQEFTLEILDKKGSKNVVEDHRSDLPINKKKKIEGALPIDDCFLDKHLLALAISSVPCYANLVNYLVVRITPPHLNSNRKKQFFSQVKSYYLEEPCLYKTCRDYFIWGRVAEEEIHSGISYYYDSPYGVAETLQNGFYWLTPFIDVNPYIQL